MPKINKKNKTIILTFLFVLVLALGITIYQVSNAALTGTPSVEITASNYDQPGSWKINKSARWTELNKAEIKFDLETIAKTQDGSELKNMDVLFVLDISGSMSGNKIAKVKSDAIELTESIMANNQNKVGIITYAGRNAPNGPSRIVQGLTTDKNIILSSIDSLTAYGMTNYNSAYKNILEALNGYQESPNRSLVVLFLTDGYPNEEVRNQIGAYQEIKDKYPNIIINGIQYEMGSTIKEDIIKVTDNQFIADMDTLNNVLFEAAEYERIYIETYDKFIIEDYIDSKFKVNSVGDIKVSIGTVTLTNENGLQKITWNLGDNFKTGQKANMTIKADLKETYHNSNGLYPTNDHEDIITKLPDENEKEETSPKTPTLPKEKYRVIYDPNNPSGCSATGFNEEYYPMDKVNISDTIPTCNGWNFKGWEIVDKTGITDITDNSFTMPEKNVTLRAIWSKPSITKSMDGKVVEDTNLSSTILRMCSEEGYTAGNGNGVYATNSYMEGSETKYHDCRYVGGDVNNYIWFNDDMYQIIGVFDDYSHGVEGQQLTKIISANLMSADAYGAYNTGNSTGTYSNYSNNWTGTGQATPASTNILLNEYFLNRKNASTTYGDCNDWTYYYNNNTYKSKSCNTLVGYGIKDENKGYIEDATWYLYGYSSNSISKQNMYLCERGGYGCTSGNNGAKDTSTQAKIGLMYPSDYLYASGYIASNATTNASSNNFGNSNWLYKGFEWTITPYSTNTNNAFNVSYDGYVNSNVADRGRGVRPSLYLKSNVYVTDGDGSFDNPYKIGI